MLPPVPSGYVTMAELARMASASKNTVHRAIQSGDLKALREASGRLLIKRSDARAWAAAYTALEPVHPNPNDND